MKNNKELEFIGLKLSSDYIQDNIDLTTNLEKQASIYTLNGQQIRRVAETANVETYLKLADLAEDGYVEFALADAEKADQEAIAASRNDISASDLFAQVNRQYTPCLLVSGAQDELVGQPDIAQLSILSELGHHITLGESGYFPMLDSAATFNRLLTDFLALDSGLSAREIGLKEEWRRRVR